jgi:hypothetical protein
MAERNGRVHMESISSRRFESIMPVLDAKLAQDTKEVATDGNCTTRASFPKRVTRRESQKGARGAGLDNNSNGGERVFAFQARHRRQLSQVQSQAPGPLHARVLLEVQQAPLAAFDLRHGVGKYGQSNTVTVQVACRVLNSTVETDMLFPAPDGLAPRLTP